MDKLRERPDGEEFQSEISGIELIGGTKTEIVEREPLLERLASLSIVRIVRIEPVGEWVTDTESDAVIGLLTAPLCSYKGNFKRSSAYFDFKRHIPNPIYPFLPLKYILCCQPFHSICIHHMKRQKHIYQRQCIRLSTLLPRSNRPNVIASQWVRRGRRKLDTSAIEEIECNYSSSSTWSKPGEEEDMRIQKSLAPLPAVGR